MFAVLETLSILEKVTPRLAAEIVWRMWRTPRKPRTVPDSAKHVMELADQSTESIAGRRIATYRWGTGPRIILLVHGWEGRASDFTAIVRELRSRERTIIAPDAPGHGKSSGKRTTVIEYGQVLAETASKIGPLEAVISHSFGTPSVAAATRNGLEADRYVSISGVADLANLVPRFCEILGMRPVTVSRVRTLIEDRVFNGDRDVWERYSAGRSPLPALRPLLVVHDRQDRMIDVGESTMLSDAHGPDTRIVTTEGLGHNRILSADVVLDEIASFLNARSESLALV